MSGIYSRLVPALVICIIMSVVDHGVVCRNLSVIEDHRAAADCIIRLPIHCIYR